MVKINEHLIKSLLGDKIRNNKLIKEVNELFNHNAELEKLRKKRIQLTKDGLEFKNNFHNEELKKTEKEIEKTERQVINLEKHSNSNHHLLQRKIELTRKKREEEKTKLVKLFSHNKYSNYYSEKLETLLLLQGKTTKHDCSFANRKIKELKEELPSNKEKLEEICKIQKQLTQLELERDNVEEVFQFFNLVMTAPIEPPGLRDEEINSKNKDTIIKTIQIISGYNKIHPSNHFPLKVINQDTSLPSTKELPKKLYDIKKKKVQETKKNNKNMEKYAILSYTWGKYEINRNLLEKAEEMFVKFAGKNSLFTWLAKKIISEEIKEGIDIMLEHKHTISDYELTFSRVRSFLKAIKVCQLLEIDYLWMDQLCVNQNNEKEKAEEISKMRQYYNNSAVTLIAIHADTNEDKKVLEMKKILKTIVNSQWFSRSWTFQEGWLSKQTIFMFDNELVDGREIAKQWVLHQPAYTDYPHYRSLLEQGTKKIATPLGWVYYKGGYDSKDMVSLSLHEALRGIKKRGRKESTDGIYSILGLLPYGEKVKVNYSLKPEQVLLHVMKEAIKAGYGEHLAWHGEGVGWLPKIDESGSTKIDGGVNIVHRHSSGIIHKSDYIEIKGLLYEIHDNKDSEITKWEEEEDGFIIESGACTKNVFIKSMVNKKHCTVDLLGMEKILNEIKENDMLALLPDRKDWRSNKPFLILLKKNKSMAWALHNWDYFPVSRGEKHTCRRAGLVEVSEDDSEKLERILGNEAIIKIKDIREKDFELTKKFFSNFPTKWNQLLDNEEAIENDFSHQEKQKLIVTSHSKETKEFKEENSDHQWRKEEFKEETTNFLLDIDKRNLEKGYKELDNKTFEQKKEIEGFKDQLQSLEFENGYLHEQQSIKLEESQLETSNKIDEDWKSVHCDFTFETKEEWKKKGFSYEQTKEWISIGLHPVDSSYAQWLREEVKLIPEEVLNEENEEILRSQYQNLTNHFIQKFQIEQPPKK